MNLTSRKERQHFDFLIPENQEWFSPKEVAAIIGKSPQFVRDAFDNQIIMGHASNSGKYKSSTQKGKKLPLRKTYQIHRNSITLFMLETANYQPKEFLKRVETLLKHRAPEELLKIQTFVQKRLKKHGIYATA